jgi:HEAT repeat protein
MSQPLDSRSPGTIPDHGLPPVEPPSARFIVQLFVVPAVIVSIIVLVWLLFNWLAQMGSDPTKYVEALRRNTKVRWQAAASLADLLNDSRNAHLKRDRRLAGELASLLNDELKHQTLGEEQVMLSAFLCRALGEFEVPEAVGPLVAAAGRTEPEDVAVRRAAIEGLAILSSNLPARVNPDQSGVDRVLGLAAADGDDQIRSAAAFALGVVGDEQSTALLKKLLFDVYPDVRYNAATGLARHGDGAGLAVILEMLDPVESPTKSAPAEQSSDFKHGLIAVNGLQAALSLYPTLSAADRQAVRDAIARLENKDEPADVRLRASEVLKQLNSQ